MQIYGPVGERLEEVGAMWDFLRSPVLETLRDHKMLDDN